MSDFQPSGHEQCISQTETNRGLANADTVVVNVVSGKTLCTESGYDFPRVVVYLSVPWE